MRLRTASTLQFCRGQLANRGITADGAIVGAGEAEQQQAEAERVVRSASRLLAATRAAAEYMADSVGRSKERLEAAIERRRRPAALVAMVRSHGERGGARFPDPHPGAVN